MRTFAIIFSAAALWTGGASPETLGKQAACRVLSQQFLEINKTKVLALSAGLFASVRSDRYGPLAPSDDDESNLAFLVEEAAVNAANAAKGLDTSVFVDAAIALCGKDFAPK
ncbi:MAG: hypothetical protein VXW57_09145 [Pseudomonadota bacterium]|nr:hypothetical protein [Pseudomonadota bacterium]